MPDLKYSQLTPISAVSEAQEWGCNDAGVSRRFRVQDLSDFLFKRISGSSGAAGPYKTLQTLTADVDVTGTTPTTVMTTTGVGPGTWAFAYGVPYISGQTNTGISIIVAHTGTVSTYLKRWYHITSGSTDSTGIGASVAGNNTGQMVEGHATNVNAQDEGATAGVTVANSDIYARVEGFIVVTASGNLELRIRASSSTGTVGVRSGTTLELTKVL